jgi:hypothetical protein
LVGDAFQLCNPTFSKNTETVSGAKSRFHKPKHLKTNLWNTSCRTSTMSPSCCNGKQDHLSESSVAPVEECSSVSKPGDGETCCYGDQVEPAVEADAQTPVKNEKTASPCTECNNAPSPGQPCCDGKLACTHNQFKYNNSNIILKESCMVRIAVRECEDSCGFDNDCTTISSGRKDSRKFQIPSLLCSSPTQHREGGRLLYESSQICENRETAMPTSLAVS